MIHQVLHLSWYLILLVRAGQGSQTQAVLLKQISGLFCTDVAFIAQNLQIGMLAEQFKANFQVRCIGRSEEKIENETVQCDQEMLLPLAEHFSFDIPAPAFADLGHRDQLAIATSRFWPRSFKQRRNLLPYVAYQDVHPQAEIVKVVYHLSFLVLYFSG